MFLKVLWCISWLDEAIAVQNLGRSVFRRTVKAANHTHHASHAPAVHSLRVNLTGILEWRNEIRGNLDSPWCTRDMDVANAVLRRGFNFMSKVAAQPEHIVLNTVSFFAELEQTASDPEVRAAARSPAVNAAHVVEQRILRAWRHGTFGQMLGTRHDVVEGLQLLRYQVDLGLVQTKVMKDSLLSAIHDAWLDCDSCRSPIAPAAGESGSADGAAKQYLRLLDGVVGASVVDEGSFLFGLHAPRGLLAQAFANAVAPFCQIDDDVVPGTAEWRAKSYLATHIIFVATGFDRFSVPAGYTSLNNVLAWIRCASDEALNHVDDTDHGIELLSEFVAALKAANATEQNDSFIRKSARIIIQRQHDDGRWGLQKDASDPPEDYNILHHVWTAMSALRGRRIIQSPYSKHLHAEIGKGSRKACRT